MKGPKQKPVDNSVGSETILWYNKGWNDAIDICQQRIRELESKYNELLMAVAQKHPNETRHQTALRYIRQREAGCHGPHQTVEEPPR